MKTMPWLNFELTLEQTFLMRQLEEVIKDYSREELEKFLLETVRLKLVGDNLVKQLMRGLCE